MKTRQLYESAVARLHAVGVAEASEEVVILLGHVLGLNRAELFLANEQPVTDYNISRFESYLAERLARKPLSYILGEQEFWSRSFLVTPDVLIPRPETEFLLDLVLTRLRETVDLPSGPFLELGAGSGVISVVLALEIPAIRIYAVDRSLAALSIASVNVRRHRVANRVWFIGSNWFGGLAGKPRFSLIVSNPPYVDRDCLADLQPEVRDHEPHMALDGGCHGMEEIHTIAQDLESMLLPGGYYFMEIGADQGEEVTELFAGLRGFEQVEVFNDYAGLPRVLQARRKRG